MYITNVIHELLDRSSWTYVIKIQIKKWNKGTKIFCFKPVLLFRRWIVPSQGYRPVLSSSCLVGCVCGDGAGDSKWKLARWNTNLSIFLTLPFNGTQTFLPCTPCFHFGISKQIWNFFCRKFGRPGAFGVQLFLLAQSKMSYAYVYTYVFTSVWTGNCPSG